MFPTSIVGVKNLTTGHETRLKVHAEEETVCSNPRLNLWSPDCNGLMLTYTLIPLFGTSDLAKESAWLESTVC
jgi:hypothetical protein